MCSISNGSRDNSSTRFQRVSISRHQFVTSPTITWDSGDLLWNTLLIDCSSHRGAHFCHWHICSIPNGCRDNSSTMFQRVSITRHQFVTSPTITWDPRDLLWKTLLIDCSSHWGAHFCHWHICFIPNGSRDNSSKRFRRVSITRQPFVTSATITWDSGDLVWNTLLIDCSSHRGAHYCNWHICSIPNGSRDNSSTRFPAGFHYSPAIFYISHYSLRSRRFAVKDSISRFFFSSRRTFLQLTYFFYPKWFSRQFKYKVPAGFHYSPPICYISHYNLRFRRFNLKHSINRLFFSSRRTFLLLTYLFYPKWFSR